MQYAVRKNIFTPLFNVHNTRSLLSHKQVRLIRLHFEILPPPFTKKSLQICYKKRFKKISWSCQRNRTPSAKRLSQTPFFRFWLRASLLIESFLLILKTTTACFEHDIFRNNLKDKGLWTSLFLPILQVASKIGIHHRYFSEDNFASKNVKELSLVESFFNIKQDYGRTVQNSTKLHHRWFNEGVLK